MLIYIYYSKFKLNIKTILIQSVFHSISNIKMYKSLTEMENRKFTVTIELHDVKTVSIYIDCSKLKLNIKTILRKSMQSWYIYVYIYICMYQHEGTVTQNNHKIKKQETAALPVNGTNSKRKPCVHWYFFRQCFFPSSPGKNREKRIAMATIRGWSVNEMGPKWFAVVVRSRVYRWRVLPEGELACGGMMFRAKGVWQSIISRVGTPTQR